MRKGKSKSKAKGRMPKKTCKVRPYTRADGSPVKGHMRKQARH